jgi:hypothetical protein
VMLCITSDGTKLPPMAIFKRKTIPKEKFPKGIIVEANEKGWVNETIMEHWVEKIWKRRKGAFYKTSFILNMDSCRAHLTDKVKNLIFKYSKLAIIPAGLTRKLQPLDVAVNISFKSHLKQKWEQWMIDGVHEYSKTGKMKQVSYSEICAWICDSWESVSVSSVINWFKKALGNISVSEEREVDMRSDGIYEDEREIPDISNEIIQLIESFKVGSEDEFEESSSYFN